MKTMKNIFACFAFIVGTVAQTGGLLYVYDSLREQYFPYQADKIPVIQVDPNLERKS